MTRRFAMRKSAMQAFKYCERYFYYAIIAGLQEPFKPYEAQMGTDFHRESADFYNKVDVRQTPSVAYYRSLLPQGTPIDSAYDNFANFESNRMQAIRSMQLEPRKYFLPIAKELTIVLEDQLMQGTLDRIFLLDSNEPLIIDVKPHLPEVRTSLRRELAFYLYLANEYEPLADEWGPFEYAGGYGYNDNLMWYEKIGKKTTDAMFDTLDLIDFYISTRTQKAEWERNYFANCAGCPYQFDCWNADEISLPFVRKEDKDEWAKADLGSA
jgi:CRISPR/Cas system-associated exonuclease Cas4 (RecB family)